MAHEIDRAIMPVAAYYERLYASMEELGLPWPLPDDAQAESEAARLAEVMGPAEGRAALDVGCGWGLQSVALARLGWRVTGADVTERTMAYARAWAERAGLDIALRRCDMRDVGRQFDGEFDWALSFFALYELDTERKIRAALAGVRRALRPGGRLYLRLRDMDFLLEEQPRHRLRAERRTEHGRVLVVDDWQFTSATGVVALTAFIREDERVEGFGRWTTETIGVRKRLLLKADLARLLGEAGFEEVTFLPQAAPWEPFEVVARRP